MEQRRQQSLDRFELVRLASVSARDLSRRRLRARYLFEFEFGCDSDIGVCV